MQQLVLNVYFGFTDSDRLDELVPGAIITIVLTTSEMIFLLAIGAWSEHGIGMTEFMETRHPGVAGIRSTDRRGRASGA